VVQTQDVTRTTLLVILTVLLIGGCIWVLRPFIGAILWGGVIVISTWPIFLRLEQALKGRRSLAVSIMTMLILLVVMLPILAAIGTLVAESGTVVEWVKGFIQDGLGPAPTWFDRIPWAGAKLTEYWQDLSQAGTQGLVERAEPYTSDAVHWLLRGVGTMGVLIFHLLLTAAIAAVFYSNGPAAARKLTQVAWRIGHDRGKAAIVLAAQAVRGVALGIVVTSLVQSILAGIGMLICGVPHAGLFTALVFVLCVAQIGPFPVLVPIVGWLYWQDHHIAGTVMLVWSLLVGLIDNFLRPALIRRGVDLPLLLILPGVIGGLLSLGIIGLFIGPVVLAVTYILMEAWIGDETLPKTLVEPAPLVKEQPGQA
jgi:predicted PurR-regulated permease PerM